MTSTELAKLLSDAALAHRASKNDQTLAELESLARQAAEHVRRVGQGTVDHIVLSNVLKLIVADAATVKEALDREGWRWSR